MQVPRVIGEEMIVERVIIFCVYQLGTGRAMMEVELDVPFRRQVDISRSVYPKVDIEFWIVQFVLLR